MRKGQGLLSKSAVLVVPGFSTPSCAGTGSTTLKCFRPCVPPVAGTSLTLPPWYLQPTEPQRHSQEQVWRWIGPRRYPRCPWIRTSIKGQVGGPDATGAPTRSGRLRRAELLVHGWISRWDPGGHFSVRGARPGGRSIGRPPAQKRDGEADMRFEGQAWVPGVGPAAPDTGPTLCG